MEGQRTGPAQELGLLSFVAAYVQVITSISSPEHHHALLRTCATSGHLRDQSIQENYFAPIQS